IADRHAGAGAGAAAVVIGYRDADGVAAAGRLIEILMADAAEAQHARSQVHRAAAVVAPVDEDRKSVVEAKGGEAGGERGRAVITDGRWAVALLDVGWCDIIDCHAGASGGAAAVVIADRDADGIAAAG